MNWRPVAGLLGVAALVFTACQQGNNSTSVSGGKAAESGPCEPYAAHGYFGREAETAAAIAAWILGRSFPKDVE